MEYKDIRYIGKLKEDIMAYYDCFANCYIISKGYEEMRKATNGEIRAIKGKFREKSGELEKKMR